MRKHARPGSAPWLATALLCGLAVAGCQSDPRSRMMTDPPPQVGAGDCPVEVRNSAIRQMEVYFHLGMESPPPDRRLWSRAGFLDPARSLQINAICDEEFIRVVARMRIAGRDRWVGEERRLVEGRDETIRLRERR